MSQSEEFNNNSSKSISLWMETHIPSPPPLEANLEVDVCVVGSGIAGLSCAYFLAKEGKSVVVIDKGALAGGQSARTTGHLSFILDERYFELTRLFGEKTARLAAESHRAAIDAIEAIVKEENIPCDFERLDGYLFVPPGGSFDILDTEMDSIYQLGLEAYKIEQAPFESFDTDLCLRFPNQGQFHILKYLGGLIKAIEKQGGRLFAYTRAIDFEEEPDQCKVITENKHTISCKSLIVATDTPVNDRFMIHTKQAAYRTYVIAAPVPKDSIPHGLYWDTLNPYHYIRLQKDTSDLDWLIIGGEDHKTGQDTENLEKYAILEEWARDRFPMMGAIQYRWSGQIMESVDGLAFIGRNPHRHHTYIATGDSGNGLTHGTVAGLLIRDLILKRANPWENIYDPSRKTLAAAAKFVKENLNVAAQYFDWIMPGQVHLANQIPLDSGAVIRKGLNKYAVYRDKEGEIFCCSAVCPHLGGIVSWNPSEKSWDCPCHGSRFDAYGTLLNGPAVSDLPVSKEV